MKNGFFSKRIFVCDFETTSYDGQESTEVWAAASVELYTENVNIFHSIEEWFLYMSCFEDDIRCYFHNLKFDGSFIISFLLNNPNFSQALVKKSEAEYDVEFPKDVDMEKNTYKYMISEMGQWYSITIKTKHNIIQIYDSLKLLPFSVKRIGNSFGTKHKKLDMEYKGYRYAGCEITEEEKKYIANDVLVVKEALEIMFDEGHTDMTIGSCCMKEFKKKFDNWTFNHWLFPDLYQYYFKEIDEEAGKWIRRAYRGGWCYVAKGKENKVFHNGTTADVNSLYPSMMSSESGNYYPVGYPIFWKGNYIPDEAKINNRYFFVRFKTRFYLKKDKLPFIQIKNNMCYLGTEQLETSDLIDSNGNSYRYYIKDGVKYPATVTLTMTMTDYYLMLEQYDLEDFEILDGCYFETEIGIFDDYIQKYKKIKQESKGAIRELAKLFLNNLYGKMATSQNSSFKVAKLKDDGAVTFIPIEEFKKKAGYIPIGCAITSYARNFTIRAAQANYHGKDKRGFIYADTDSIHCDLMPDEIKGINVHPTNFCCWKLESQWDDGWFVRQKTYIEHITHEDQEKIEHPYYNIKCAGLPEKCKLLLARNFVGDTGNENDNEKELEFLKTKRTIKDFKIGIKIPGKLMTHRIKGGIVLKDSDFEMR